MVRRHGRGWVLALLGIGIGFPTVGAAPAPRPKGDDIPQEAMPLAGRWDITVRTSRGEAYSWLEVEPSGATLVGRFVGRFGSARPLSKVAFSQGTLHFTLPPQYEEHDLEFEGKMEADRLTGTVLGYDKSPCVWTAKRAPSLKRGRPPRWGKPMALFNGVNLTGWKAQGETSHWTVNHGVLVNTESGANLLTTAAFDDFKLHIEFRYPKGSNSGVYLRGRYEVQIDDDAGSEPDRHSSGALYGFFAPCLNRAKAPGVWQTFDITLVGRMVTVVFNGETVIDRQTIPGITGGAVDAEEGSPGPLLLQGDHGRIDYRNIVLIPGT